MRHGAPYWVAHRARPARGAAAGGARRAADRAVDGLRRRRGGERRARTSPSLPPAARRGPARRSSPPTGSGRRCASCCSTRPARSSPARAPRAPSLRSTSCRRISTGRRRRSGCSATRTSCTTRCRGGAELAVVVVLDDQHDNADWSAPVPPVVGAAEHARLRRAAAGAHPAGARLAALGAAHAVPCRAMDARSDRTAGRCGAPGAAVPGAGRRHGAGGCGGARRRRASPTGRYRGGACCSISASGGRGRARRARLAPQRAHLSHAGALALARNLVLRKVPPSA